MEITVFHYLGITLTLIPQFRSLNQRPERTDLGRYFWPEVNVLYKTMDYRSTTQNESRMSKSKCLYNIQGAYSPIILGE